MIRAVVRPGNPPPAAGVVTGPTPAPWDRDLAPGEVKRLAPVDRGRRALLSLERKVALIEAEARRAADAPARPDLPINRAKLRRWTMAVEGLWEWSDPQFDHPGGRNAALIARFTDALDLLRARKRRGRAGLQAELAARDRLVRDLELQAGHLIGENRELRERVARLTAETSR